MVAQDVATAQQLRNFVDSHSQVSFN